MQLQSLTEKFASFHIEGIIKNTAAILSEEEKTRQQAWGEEGLVSPGPQRRLRSLGSREASLASSKGEGPPTSVWRLL